MKSAILMLFLSMLSLNLVGCGPAPTTEKGLDTPVTEMSADEEQAERELNEGGGE